MGSTPGLEGEPHFRLVGGAMPVLRRGDLFELLEIAAAEFPERPHLTYEARSLSYRETLDLSLRLAARLRDAGLMPGDRVGLCMANSPAYIVACFALWRLGLVGVGMNGLYAHLRLVEQAQDAGVSLVIAAQDDPSLGMLRLAAGAAGCELLVVHPALEAELVDVPAHSLSKVDIAPRPKPADLAMLQYTGGTTGAPKGAMLTHQSLLAATAQGLAWMRHVTRGAEAWHAPAPLTHISGVINYACIATAAAGECLLVGRYQADELLQQLRAGRPTILTAIPTMLTGLLALPTLEGAQWTRVKHVIAGGAPTPLELLLRFREATGLDVLQAYGMTETSGTATGMPTGVRGHDEATGVPLPGVRLEIRSLEAPDQSVPPGECGEICIGGDNVMRGYWQRPNRDHLTSDGLMRTGDIGRLDGQGFLHVVDRLKDVVICSGYNVYPRLIDEAVLQHPDIREAIALGMPDPYRGETIVVAAALKPGRSLSLDQLQAHLQGRLSPIEMPKRLILMDDLPKSENGKLSRALVKSHLLAAPAGQGV